MSSLKDLLAEDIKRQKDVAEKALKQAKDLDEALSQPGANPLLKEVRDTLVEIARNLAANTTSTSSLAVDIIRKSKD